MKADIVEKLHRLNQEFYQSFSSSFSLTRQRIQPGVRKIMQSLREGKNLLDIGCGNGNLAVELVKNDWGGTYLGIDFSEDLVGIANKKVSTLRSDVQIDLKFQTVDILQNGWIEKLPQIHWDRALMFAVLHHIPGNETRKDVLRSIRSFFPVGRPFFLSVWQIQNSPRLLQRIRTWKEIGMEENQVDPGDVLMDWRAQNPGEEGKPGLRYVHLFTENELNQLATETGFRVIDQYYSDGKEGNLALYQKWL